MDSAEPCVPPGFRFHPTDEELVGYYLRKKVSSHKIDLDVIKDIDLYRIEPWDLQEYCRIGYEEQSEWYFFNHKDKKYPTGTRTNRATMAGFWKATGRDKAVRDKKGLIGMRKTLVFYEGRAPHGKKTDWIMHEYRLESEENGPPPQEEGWVVCRAFKKRANIQPKTVDIWDSTFVYTAESPTNYLQSLPHNQMCKQETEVDNLHLLNSNFFVELPQLNNPSLLTLTVENEDDERAKHCNAFETVTDWRALDKFAASQLSPEDRIASNQVTDFVVDKNSEMALLLLQAGMEEARQHWHLFI